MRKDTFFSKIFAGFISVFLIVLCFTLSVNAADDDDKVELSNSLKDDVSAMITNAKKMPHQIFVIDSSESMNSFAYSDYVDSCRDGETTLQKALDLCNNAYTQCRNVENNASCSVDLGCSDVKTKCSTIGQRKKDLHDACEDILENNAEPDMFETLDFTSKDLAEGESDDAMQARKYVGPWDPRQHYDEDLCFYNWTADTNGDVISATLAYQKEKEAAAANGTDINYDNLYPSTADAYNKKKLCEKWGVTDAACDEKYNDFLEKNGGFIADRRDWDCLTDGSNNVIAGNTSLSWQQAKSLHGGVSGHWLNWKYSTSMDALKIILADRHEFSFPPRKRGDDSCYKTNYTPVVEYQEALIDEEGNPVECTQADVDSNNHGCETVHQPIYESKKACFVAFEPTFSGADGETVPDETRRAQLNALKAAINAMWTLEAQAAPDPGEGTGDDDNSILSSKCSGFNILSYFSIFTKDNYSTHIDDSREFSCDKCWRWELNPDGTGTFVETGCSQYQGTTNDDSETKNIGSVSATFSKSCCKTFKCSNPKCRDNDICCKNNASAYPDNEHGGDETSEGYKTCREGGDYSCALGFYSEFDQDTNHCCGDTECSETGGVTQYHDVYLNRQCDKCESGLTLGSDIAQTTTGVKTILEPQTNNSYCGAGSSEDDCRAISVDVGIKDTDVSSIDFNEIASIKLDVYYDCTDSGADNPSNLLGSATCDSASTCSSSMVSGELSGCGDAGVGYRMEARVTITRTTCKFEEKSVTFNVVASFGENAYMTGNYTDKKVFDPEKAFYHTYGWQTGSSTERVYEYECKASFYNREVVTLSGSSCPNANNAPAYINRNREGDKVEYCEARTAEREVIDRDQWFNPTQVACSWLCRTAVTYDDPWKCTSVFFMMDDIDRNGPSTCNNQCYNAMSSNKSIASCCKCINSIQSQYYHHETPGKVNMVDPDTNNYATYTCSVSGYQYATGSDGSQTTAGGFQAEIINGTTTEGGKSGYYNLSPYKVKNDQNEDVFWTPYVEVDGEGWYTKLSLIHSENGQGYLGDSLTSVFTTGETTFRNPVCVYDILWGWSGEDCNSCGTGCCSVDISQDSNNCDYPQFWMKMPEGEGGKLVMAAKNLYSDENAEDDFRNTVKGLKALGSPTLGETLYDVWRYLGGMKALYDPEHINIPYTSPYAANDPQCFTNEAVLISGGNPQFDANYKLKQSGVVSDCPEFDPEFGEPAKDVKPCVKDEPKTTLSQHSPYLGGDDPASRVEWQRTSLVNVAKFVNRNTFWGKESCRTANAGPILTSDGRFKSGNCEDDDDSNDECCGNDPSASKIDAKYPVIDRLHSIGIGEWGLATMYQSLTNSASTYLQNGGAIKKAAETTGRDGESGRYYTLTAAGNARPSDTSTFNDLTALFSAFVNEPRPSDVVVGRPHWTSSMVQPFDVEEKYRGPEVYTAGAIPVAGAVSRFWFGNLKRYEISSDNEGSCPIYDDEDADCGEWKKQTFDAQDCFSLGGDDVESGFSVAEDASTLTAKNLGEFKKLMVGGAAERLANKLNSASCSTDKRCYKSVNRDLYTDYEGDMVPLRSLEPSQLLYKFKQYDDSFTEDAVGQVFDYMAGFDSFANTEAKRKTIRYKTSNTTFTVDDPFEVDFDKKEKTKLTLRPLLLGAIVHSKPVAVYYDDTNDTRIYVGANDGMLHAFNGNGDEVYAYIPSLAYKSIAQFKNSGSNQIFFNATVDGPITMLHIDQSHDGIINNGEKAYLIFGYRRGAKGYTVIDISNKDKPEFIQNLNTDGGYSFGKAAVFRKCPGVCSYADELDYYLAVPGGYDMCHDPSALTLTASDNKVSCSAGQLSGNKFTIYKFSKTDNKFNKEAVFSTGSDSALGSTEKQWLVTSFTSVPFVVNTVGKASVNTEFIYFSDLSGTVFRVDVRKKNKSDWKAKIVFAKRQSSDIQKWDSIGRTFVASNFFPPLERYNPSKEDGKNEDGTDGTWRIPIPIISGNAANPKFKKPENLFVFYDEKDPDDDSDFITTSDTFVENEKGNSFSPKNQMIDGGPVGWRLPFNITNGEKGITEPLIVYDIYGSSNSALSRSYSIAWNTYIPKDMTQCKSFGTSSNYERYVPDGSQAFEDLSVIGTNGEWTFSTEDSAKKCIDNSEYLSLATGVGIVSNKETGSYDLTFGAGANIFRKEKLSVLKNATYIIKWYELY